MHVQLPAKGGVVDYTYDDLGRSIKMKTQAFQQYIPKEGFDEAGNLRLFYAQDLAYHFDYDDLYQLKAEEGHEKHAYQFDSLFNRTLKDKEKHTYNALNQVCQKGAERLIYDKNGNLTQRKLGQETVFYEYDALDRLISVKQGKHTTTYVYDPFNRRLCKDQKGQESQLFVYQGQEEIGCWCQGAFQELRLLGEKSRSAMVALEIKGTLYVPVHDLVGNVVCLLDAQGKVVERYRYTAFGESEILNPQGKRQKTSIVGNPWRYASKRFDEETGFVAFGLRYYDPGLGRWVTADPAGFEDGPNLYAYVHNSPLRYYDQYGLFSLSDCPIFEHKVNPINLEACFLSTCSADQHLNSLSVADDILPSPWYYERAEIYDLNRSEIIDPETNKPFNLPEMSRGMIGYMNGASNEYKDFQNSLIYLGKLAGYNVSGVHSPSFGFFGDTVRYLAARLHIGTETVKKIRQLWDSFFARCPEGYILWFCHSRGVVDSRNALEGYPVELQRRIKLVPIAPGAFVHKRLCGEVTHLVSTRDVVPWLNPSGMLQCRSTVNFLTPHPNAPVLDHTVISETYKSSILSIINDFVKEYQ
jgi:RHS repeat-associated protein